MPTYPPPNPPQPTACGANLWPIPPTTTGSTTALTLGWFWLGRPHPNKAAPNPAAAPQTLAVMRPPGACPGLSKPAQLSTTQVRIAPEPCLGLGCLGCFVQGWPGLDRLPPYPPAIHAYGARPQGGEGRRAPTYKPQRFREQKASRTRAGLG